MDSLDGSAIFTVISEYRGSKADYMRAYFNNSTKENIHKEYLNFYSVLYPSISLNEDVSFVDDARPWENIFTTHESYTIETPWSNSDNGEGSYLETYSLVLESLVNYAKSAKREMPYYLGEPFTFEQVTRISLPEPWFIQNEDTAVDDESFSYRRDVKSLGILVTISRAYALKKQYIEGKDTPAFLTKQNDLRNTLGYQLMYTNTTEIWSSISWLSVLIALISLSLCVFVALKLYKDYNPIYEGTQQPMVLGGWLILPVIGLFLTPFLLLYQLFTTGYFEETIWQAFELGSYENHKELNVFMGFELFSTIAFLIFSIPLIVLFLQKRTSFPKLIIYFYGVKLGILTLSSLVLNKYGVPDPTAIRDIVQAMISAAIWIPYFIKSTRVKNTFNKTFGIDLVDFSIKKSM